MCDGERWGTLGVKGPVSSGAKQRGPEGGAGQILEMRQRKNVQDLMTD